MMFLRPHARSCAPSLPVPLCELRVCCAVPRGHMSASSFVTIEQVGYERITIVKTDLKLLRVELGRAQMNFFQ